MRDTISANFSAYGSSRNINNRTKNTSYLMNRILIQDFWFSKDNEETISANFLAVETVHNKDNRTKNTSYEQRIRNLKQTLIRGIFLHTSSIPFDHFKQNDANEDNKMPSIRDNKMPNPKARQFKITKC
jgi:hypothetical protein